MPRGSRNGPHAPTVASARTRMTSLNATYIARKPLHCVFTVAWVARCPLPLIAEVRENKEQKGPPRNAKPPFILSENGDEGGEFEVFLLGRGCCFILGLMTTARGEERLLRRTHNATHTTRRPSPAFLIPSTCLSHCRWLAGTSVGDVIDPRLTEIVDAWDSTSNDDASVTNEVRLATILCQPRVSLRMGSLRFKSCVAP